MKHWLSLLPIPGASPLGATALGMVLALGGEHIRAPAINTPPAPRDPKKAPAEAPHRVKPYDVLKIQATPAFPGEPIDSHYLVGPDGGVYLGPSYGVVSVDGLTPEKATKAVVKRLGELLKDPRVTLTPAGRVSGWQIAFDRAKLSRIKTGQKLHIEVTPTPPEARIAGLYFYPVDKDGKVDLGKSYGKVSVAGLTLDQAAVAIEKQLARIIKNPRASVWQSAPEWEKSYRVKEGQVHTIVVTPNPFNAPISSLYRVTPEGQVVFRPEYGQVAVAGLTLDEARAAIREQLAKTIRGPQVAVFPGSWDEDWYKRKDNKTRQPDQDPPAQKSKREE